MIAEVKQAIADKLGTVAGVKQVISTAFLFEALADSTITKYPAAIVQPPTLSSDWHDSGGNKRLYIFAIPVIMRSEGTKPAGVETLMEQIIDAFDTDATLGGLVQGAIKPASTPVRQAQIKAGNMILFEIILECYTIYEIPAKQA